MTILNWEVSAADAALIRKIADGHLNRLTGKLEDYFSPRCTARQVV